MSGPAHIVEIDRIVLTDLGVTPERAEHIRALVTVELQRILAQEGWLGGLSNGEVSHLDASEVHLPAPHSENHLANGLAQSIAQTLRGIS